MDIKVLRDYIKEVIKESLEEVNGSSISLVPTEHPFGTSGGHIHKKYNIVENKKKILGTCTTKIPTEDNNSPDALVTINYSSRTMTNAKEESNIIKSIAPDIIEDITDPIKNNPYIFKIIIEGIRTPSVQDKMIEQLQLSGFDTFQPTKKGATISIIIGEPRTDSMHNMFKHSDEFGRTTYKSKDKPQPYKSRDRKPTVMRKRKRKSSNDDNNDDK